MSENQEQSSLNTNETAGDEPSSESPPQSKILAKVPPEELLDAAKLKLIRPVLQKEDNPTILREYLAYEQSHQVRGGVKNLIQQEIRRAGGDIKPGHSSHSSDPGKVEDSPGPEDILATDDIDAIREELQDVSDTDLLQECRTYETEHRERRPVLEAIELRTEFLQ
jgi:hypothetical protein